MIGRLASAWVSVSTASFLDFAGLRAMGSAPLDYPVHHLSERLLHPLLELRLHPVNVLQLRERPASEGSEMVDPRHPIGLRRELLLLRILAAIALDLNDEVEQVLLPMA